jgi:hypothetical protein
MAVLHIVTVPDERGVYSASAKPKEYDGNEDAARILEKVLHRTRYSASVRLDLAAALEAVVGREVGRRKHGKGI